MEDPHLLASMAYTCVRLARGEFFGNCVAKFRPTRSDVTAIFLYFFSAQSHYPRGISYLYEKEAENICNVIKYEGNREAKIFVNGSSVSGVLPIWSRAYTHYYNNNTRRYNFWLWKCRSSVDQFFFWIPLLILQFKALCPGSRLKTFQNS